MDSDDGAGRVMSRTLGEIFADMIEEAKLPRTRYPVVRTGERDPIPWMVRLSVYQRDGRSCRFCGLRDQGVELDHMLPWSADGNDASANLRCLCSPCNQRRSNWYDGEHHPNLRPTTWWCRDCWRHPDFEGPPNTDDPQPPQRVYRTPWRDGTDLNLVPYVIEPTIQVYCAWCWGYGWTDRAFVEGQQAELAAMCGAA